MKISAEGIELIRHFEGVRNRPYRCSAGLWTVGLFMLFAFVEIFGFYYATHSSVD